MKRFHVHLSVDDLSKNIRFYSAMFGAPPTVEKADYAKWMLDDRRLNFAISQRGGVSGVNHLGLQVDTEEDLRTLCAQVTMGDIQARDQAGASCCYAKSDKYWVQDPQGIAWETFHTLGDIPVCGEHANTAEPAASGSCVPETKLSFGPRLEAKACCG
jgi:catechol 2,3-dioxygenase-like lactoylglutathione lyase family enzyme